MIEIINDENCIYLDSAATTLPDVRVLDDIEKSLREDWYNPSGIYEQGKEVKRKIERSKEQVRRFLKCDGDDEITFCSCGSEANNLAIKGFMSSHKNPLLINTLADHPSIYKVSDRYYYSEDNPEINNIICANKDDGKINLNDLTFILDNVTDYGSIDADILVAVTWVNNETGVINDLEKICEIAHKYGAYVLADLSQGIAHKEVFMKTWGVDMATFTSEKMYMPRGAGVLYSRKGIDLDVQIEGGSQQKFRAGTEPQYMYIALGNQCERISNELDEYIEKEYELEDALLTAIHNAHKGICDCRINVITGIPNIVSIQFKGYYNQELLSLLGEYNVLCSAGSACSSGEGIPSRILKSMGLSEKEIFNTIRFSFDHKLKPEDIKRFEKILRKCLMALKRG